MIRRLLICTLLVSGVVLAAADPGIANAAVRLSGVGTNNTSAKPSASPSWSVQVTPKKLKAPGQPLGISCATPTSCVAVGYYQSVSGLDVPLAESWNGESWTVNATPTVLINFRGLRLGPGIDECVVHVAHCLRSRGLFQLLPTRPGRAELLARCIVERIELGLTADPNVADPANGENDLTGVSCVTSAFCTAVGWDINPEGGSGNPTTMAEIWDGTAWTIEPTAPLTGTSQFNGVTCSSATECVAVGTQNGQPLAETWNGSTWTVETTPNPAGATSSSLASVSCSGAGTCSAVGSYSTTTSTASFAENWDGTAWTLEAVPEPAGATSSSLSGVSCTGTASICTAVGVYSSGTGALTLAETWDGGTWSVQPSPDPSVDQSSSLAGVACVSGGPCLAVGTGTVDGVNEPIFVSSDGDSWIPGEIHTPGFQAESLAGIVSVRHRVPGGRHVSRTESRRGLERRCLEHRDHNSRMGTRLRRGTERVRFGLVPHVLVLRRRWADMDRRRRRARGGVPGRRHLERFVMGQPTAAIRHGRDPDWRVLSDQARMHRCRIQSAIWVELLSRPGTVRNGRHRCPPFRAAGR